MSNIFVQYTIELQKRAGKKVVGKQTFIEINGKKYDAATGKLIASKKVETIVVQPTKKATAVDGIVKPKKKPATQRSAAKHVTKNAQRSKTLVRTSVSKPKATT